MYREDSFSQPLECIEETSSMYLHSAAPYPPPETPLEPMEFLSRTWKISADDVAKALAAGQGKDRRKLPQGSSPTCDLAELKATIPVKFASSIISKMVMDRILEPPELPLVTAKRNSDSNRQLICHKNDSLSPNLPPSPTLAGDLQYYKHAPSFKLPFQGRSVRQWLKDLRERRKETSRVQNAQIHAAVCVSALASAVAAVAAATANSAFDDGRTKTSIAVASAASLVAAHCVELAENMGADCQHVAAVVSSAVNVKTAGDIMTLTAAAATALRGAALLNARNLKETRKFATVAPEERSQNPSYSINSDKVFEGREKEQYAQEVLAKGCEFLIRSRSGELNWRFVCIFLDNCGQVVLKLQSKHVGGALKKNKTSVIVDVYPDIPEWPGRNLLESGEEMRYFGLRTSFGFTEFECKSVYLHKLWTRGISYLLLLAKQQNL